MNDNIHPTAILTNCRLWDSVSVGPFCMLSDTTLGDNVIIEGNVRIDQSNIGNNCEILWWSIIRDSSLAEWCVIGCEVKKSHLWKHNKAKHPGTNIVSTTSGDKVNFWGWCKFANYDGRGKGHFILGDDIFIWCNTVISVKAEQTTTLHDGVKIGANIHVGQDVPANSLVYSDRESGKMVVREGYYKQEK